MIVDSALYHRGVRQGGNLAVHLAFDALEALAALETSDGSTGDDALVWIELTDPTEEELTSVADELQIHPLVIEDALRPHQRPKLEMYPPVSGRGEQVGENSVQETGMAFIVFKTAAEGRGGELTFGELSVVVGRRFVVTVRHGASDPVGPARRFVEGRPEFLALGVSAVLYALADAVVDDYELASDAIERSVDEVEERVFSPDADRGMSNAAALIFSQKRSTLTFLRNAAPLEEVISRLEHGRAPFSIPDEVLPYFRDVLDHLVRVRSRLEQSRELLSAALESNLAQISIRQNEDMRAISGWAAVIAVPTLFAGIWGMNFAHMPELRPVWGYPLALVTIAGSSYGTYRLMKYNRWL